MLRTEASNLLRKTLDTNGLEDWHIRLTTDLTKPFLGMCMYKDKTIILNAHHIDIHPDIEVKNSIFHEVAHALTPGHGHDAIWEAKAIELGDDNHQPCSTLVMSEEAIDAIRSGAELKIEVKERIVRDVNYKIERLQDKCPTCGKVAKEKRRVEFRSQGVWKIQKWYECGHYEVITADSRSPFEDITFDGDPNCKHSWGSGKNRTTCNHCGAHRLYKYQIDGARFLEKANGRAAIFDEQGLGKTLQALAYMKLNPKRYLWVTKSGIKYQHAKEIVRILGDDYLPQIITSGKQKLLKGMKGYLVAYDLFRRFEDLSMFANAGIELLILDEVQAIKNPDSSRTHCIRCIAKDIPGIIPLSGTPWKNRGSELFVAVNLLDPKQFWSYKGFVDKWVDTYWEGNKEKLAGIANPKAFREATKSIIIRRERAEVMPELPSISRHKLLCEVPEHARTVYNQEQKKVKDLWNSAVIDGTEGSFEVQKKLQESIMIMWQIVGLAKVDTTVEFAAEFLEETDRKLVIFVHHIECGRLIKMKLDQYCKEEGLPEPLQLTGGMNAEVRSRIQDDFNGPKYRLLIASELASGEGLNLQTCSDCIMHERQWNPANEEQAEGRFVRIGQLANAVTATYVHGDKTVDTTFDKIVDRKRIFFHNSMNKGQLTGWGSVNMVKELAAAIAKGE